MARTAKNVLYTVAFDEQSAPRPCGSAESCAQACTAGLPGFYVETRGPVVVGGRHGSGVSVGLLCRVTPHARTSIPRSRSVHHHRARRRAERGPERLRVGGWR